jgi:hypothetical protein
MLLLGAGHVQGLGPEAVAGRMRMHPGNQLSCLPLPAAATPSTPRPPVHPPSKVVRPLFQANLQARSVGQSMRGSQRAMLVVTQRRRPRLPQLSVNGTWAHAWATQRWGSAASRSGGGPSTAGDARLDCRTKAGPANAASFLCAAKMTDNTDPLLA